MAMKKDEESGGRSKKTIVIGVACVVVGAIAGPKLLPGGGSTEAASGPTTTLFERGPTLALPEVTLNLADGRLLRLGVALQFPHDPEGGEEEEAGEGESGAEDEADDPTMGHAADLDAALTVFSARTMDELLDGTIREAARQELATRIAEHDREPAVEDVLFYSFVMQ